MRMARFMSAVAGAVCEDEERRRGSAHWLTRSGTGSDAHCTVIRGSAPTSCRSPIKATPSVCIDETLSGWRESAHVRLPEWTAAAVPPGLVIGLLRLISRPSPSLSGSGQYYGNVCIG